MLAPVRLGVLCLVAVFALADPTVACECGGRGACSAYWNAGAAYWEADEVFIGVAEITTPRTQVQRVRSPHAVFTIQESFMGRATGTLEVGSPDVMGGCDYEFRHGVNYLVLAKRSPDGRLTASRCGRTLPVDDAGDDLARIRAVARGDIAGGYVAGFAHIVERLPGERERLTRVPQVMVTLRSDARVLSEETDQDGRYAFESIPPGVYRVTVRTSSLLSAPPGETVIVVPGPGACVQHTIGLSRAP